MGFQVHFSSKEAGDKLVLAVKVFEGKDEFPEVVKERKTITGSFYEREAMAFKFALETVLSEGYDSVIFYNQNKLLFDWVGKQSHDNKLRDLLYKQIRELFQEIVDEDTEVEYRIIKGNKNEAKRYLDKYVQDMEVGGDLTKLFKRDKVVSFNRKAR